MLELSIRPNKIFRVYRSDDDLTIEIRSVDNQSLFVSFDTRKECDNYLIELDKYCMQYKIKVKVSRYDEKN